MFAHAIPDHKTLQKLIADNGGKCPYKTWHIDTQQPDVNIGDTVEKAGYIVTWTDEHRTAAQLQPLRLRGDPLCDNLLSCVQPPRDLNWMDWLLRQHKSIDTNLSTVQKQSVNAVLEQMYTVPDWVDYQRVKRGQQVFLRYALPSLMALFNLSLIAGVSAPKINAVLTSTQYLSSDDTAAVYRRLMETTAWTIQLMQPDSMCIGNIGWQNCVAVRFLHGQVRQRLTRRRGNKQWDTEKNGIPINQADSATTLLAFSVNVLIGLDKVGVHLRDSEREDYIHLWRVCGWYLGVDEDVNPCTSYHQSEIDMASYVMNSVQPDEDDSTAVLANSMINALQTHYKLTTHATFKAPAIFHVYLARYLIGDYFSDQLKLPTRNITLAEHGFRVYMEYLRVLVVVPLMFTFFKFYGWLGSFDALSDHIAAASLKYLQTWSKMHTEDSFSYKFTLHHEYAPQ